MIEPCTRHTDFNFLFLCQKTHFPLLGEDKFPLGVEYIFESKFPLVVRIGLAARACGSGNGQSPSNSVFIYKTARFSGFSPFSPFFSPFENEVILKFLFNSKRMVKQICDQYLILKQIFSLRHRFEQKFEFFLQCHSY